MSRIRPPRPGGLVGALLAGALALAAPGWAVTPEPLPAPLWWRTSPEVSLLAEPLVILHERAHVDLRSEWAPLYRGTDGSRLERARRSVRVTGAGDALRAAVELDEQTASVHGGGGAWWIGAEQRLTQRGLGALAGRLGALETAVAAGARSDEPAALAAACAVQLAPGWRIESGWSRSPERGILDVRWDETFVSAKGRWTETATRVVVEGAADPMNLRLGLESLDRRTERATGYDAIEPRLAWRAAAIAVGRRIGSQWLALELEHGEGRQGMRVRREGAQYGSAAGPVSSDLVTLVAEDGATLRLRAWTGRWRSSAGGTLALWPFEELTAVLGSRRYAASSAALDHWGGSVDRRFRSGLEAGLAAWTLRPRASYESWQGILLGLGRDDPSDGRTTLRSALLLGARLGAGFRLGGIEPRVEVVQWVPVRTVEERSSGGSGSGDPGGGGSAHPLSGGAASRGGTILRLSLKGLR